MSGGTSIYPRQGANVWFYNHIRAQIKTLSNALIELKYFFGGVWTDGKTTLSRYIMVKTYVSNMAANIIKHYGACMTICSHVLEV